MEFPTRATISSTASGWKNDDKMQVEELKTLKTGGGSKKMLTKAQREIEKQNDLINDAMKGAMST